MGGISGNELRLNFSVLFESALAEFRNFIVDPFYFSRMIYFRRMIYRSQIKNFIGLHD